MPKKFPQRVVFRSVRQQGVSTEPAPRLDGSRGRAEFDSWSTIGVEPGASRAE